MAYEKYVVTHVFGKCFSETYYTKYKKLLEYLSMCVVLVPLLIHAYAPHYINNSSEIRNKWWTKLVNYLKHKV